MNFRVILLVLLVLIFTVGGIYLNVTTFESRSLEDAYNAGDLEIIQDTTAGTVPHVVMIKNNGKRPVMVETGQILGSYGSQDIVVAEDRMVNHNSSSFIRGYCYEPGQKAKPGEKLKQTGKASPEMIEIIENSNLADSNSTIQAQLQVWVIVSKDNLNTTSGEASVLLENQGLSPIETSRLLNESRSNLAENLNVSEGELKNIQPTSTVISNVFDGIGGFFNWIKNAFNIN